MEQVVECTVILDCKDKIGQGTLMNVAEAFNKLVKETLASNSNIRIQHKPTVHIGEMSFRQL